MQRPRIKQLLLPNRDQDFGTEQKLPVIKERQRTLGTELALDIHDLLAERALGCAAGDLGIPAPVAVHHVQPCHVGAWRDGVLVYAEAAWVREVRAQIRQVLEDVAVPGVAGDGDLGFQGCVGDVGYAWERGYVGLC